jgi:hypothetical protein
MNNAQRFNFTEKLDAFGVPDLVPQLPLSLTYRELTLDVLGLLDTGASVNVLPYHVGVDLGAVWDEQTTSVVLGGNLGSLEAHGLVVSAKINPFPSVRLVFAWTLSDDIPLLLGRMNFLLEFDVCLYRSQKIFEVCPAKTR